MKIVHGLLLSVGLLQVQTEFARTTVRTGIGTQVGPLGISYVHNQEISDKVFFYGLGTCAVVATAVYWGYFRESNSSIIAKIHRYVHQLDRDMQAVGTDISELAKIASITLWEQEEIFKLRATMDARYSWIKPWNWSEDMKRAYEQIRVVSVLYGYTPLLKKGQELVADDVLHFARETYNALNAFTYLACEKNLSKDIDYINAYMCNPNARQDYQTLCRQLLVKVREFRTLLVASKDYADEIKEKKAYDAQQEMIALQRQQLYRR